MANQAVGLTEGRSVSGIGRHAWKVLLAISAILGLFSLGDMFGGAANLQRGETVLMHNLTGMSWDELRAADPGAANLVNWQFRVAGAALFTIAILSAAICLTGFRRRQRWAWYTLWVLPFWLMFTAVSILAARAYPVEGAPAPVISGSIFTALWAGTLALSYRSYLK
jgi:hypothetical protein